jgi:cell division protein ZapA (FtsZ GTPase activity inhibitor)
MRSVEVRILGQSYSIKTEEEEDYILSLAGYVDEKLREIYSVMPNISQTRATVMAAFGIADELFKLKSRQEDIDRLIEEKTKILSGFLDS